MPIDLAALLAPSHTAVLTSEVQRGVVGEASSLPELATVARETVVPNTARVCAAARSAGAAVVHCVYGRRPDGRGSNLNARLFAALLKSPVRNEIGSESAQLVPELGPEPSDLVLSRMHGLNPMAGTDLDPVLRNLGVTTVVVTGVSVNVAITNLVMDAINLGYQVVLVRDAVAGVPASYAEAIIDNTLALLATVVTTAELESVWG